MTSTLGVDSRPLTPDSQLANSLHRATSTIDELTQTLTSVSRLSSPEPDSAAPCVCCCGREECDASQAWAAMKAKLESRLVLSAEVGRALLERHEALVRRQRQLEAKASNGGYAPTDVDSSVDARVAELVKQNAVLEKRLTQALMHTEVSESSKKVLLDDLDSAKSDVARLSSQNARAVGLETRLAMALQEQDDVKQELESATQRVRMTESRVVSYREKCAKLQAQVARLREDLDLQRSHRQEFSEEILNDAKQRLEQLQYHQLGHTTDIQDSEVTKVLESLVADNEVLKRDNAELQNLLAQEREEIHTLQEELEERRAGDTLSARGHRFTQSGASYTFHDTSGPLSPTFHLGTAPSGSILRSRLQREMGANNRRSISNERVEKGSREGYKPLTPETERRPLSPAESHIASGSKWTSFTRPMTPRSALHTPSHSTFSRDVDEDGSMLSPERPRATKPLLLLTRERGVQTDGPWSGGNSSMSPSPIPRNYGDQVSSHEGHSEASSLTDNIQTTAIGTLVDRTNQLLNRLTQSDALTLTNRLKRQHLLGADVSHLSRTTVNSIVNDVTALRSHFRVYLEDEKTTTTCTRRDLRSLLKLLKDVFTELGQMRVTLNDVILDPTVAGRVSEMAMNPSKVQSAEAAAGSSGGSGGASGWIAPISKLLGLPGGSSNQDSATSGAFSSARNLGRGRPPPRVVPKLQPALSASAMTVNVEFTGAGVGRSVTSTHSAHPSRMTFGLPGIGGAPPTTDSAGRVPPNSAPIAQPAPRQDVSRLMGIFAGAPKPAERDPWIVIPRPPSNTGGAKISRSASVAGLRSSVGTVGRATLRPPGVVGRRLSRIVDAIIDVQSPQLDHNDDGEGGDTVGEGAGPPPALERALRRGLSDSSIRTTFTQHGGTEDQEQPSEAGPSQPADREGVLQALSRRMQAFRFATGTPSPAEVEGLPVEGGRPRTPVAKSNASTGSGNAASKPSPPRAIPQTRKRGESASGNAGASASTSLFGLASWAAPYDEMEEAERPRVSGPYFAGSPREDAFAQRNWTRDRDF